MFILLSNNQVVGCATLVPWLLHTAGQVHATSCITFFQLLNIKSYIDDNFSFLPCADDPRPLVDLEPAPGAVPDEEVVEVVVGVGILGLSGKN